MSNVLIGIIGVILFIGLALAGALFLGPRFQESTNSSKASATVQAVAQVGSAANMSNVQTGAQTQVSTTASTLQTNGFLKSIPSNPINVAGVPQLALNDGTNSGTAAATYVTMDLGSAADAVCTVIARQTGQAPTATTSPTSTTVPSNGAGCFKYTGAANGSLATQNNFYAFSRI